jgi:methylthioribose-1-phosphate isomerase
MKVDGVPYRSLWTDDAHGVHIIDQTWLPHLFETRRLANVEEVAEAIRSMRVRGAPLIGVTAAFGVALALARDPSDASLARACTELAATRPTAVNLAWALARMRGVLSPVAPGERARAAWHEAQAIAEEDVARNESIGIHGLALIAAQYRKTGTAVNVLTHCNAGWLATVDWGTITAPVFKAHDSGIPVHVWVSETRPRNQGLLTAWELRGHGVPHTLVADNACGHLMQRGRVDLVIVGADRVTRTGDVANKIGTYLKALAAKANGVPFYAAVPSPTIDWTLVDGLRSIKIEERAGDELRRVRGLGLDGRVTEIVVAPPEEPVANPAFDVTPAELVTGLVTERGICAATEEGLAEMFRR